MLHHTPISFVDPGPDASEPYRAYHDAIGEVWDQMSQEAKLAVCHLLAIQRAAERDLGLADSLEDEIYSLA